jgi:hypothetical protein
MLHKDLRMCVTGVMHEHSFMKIRLIYIIYIYKLITCIASRTTESRCFTIAEGSLRDSLNSMSKRPILLHEFTIG